MTKPAFILGLFASAIIAFVSIYFFQLTLSFGFIPLWGVLGLIALILVVCYSIDEQNNDAYGDVSIGGRVLIGAISIALFALVWFFTTAPMVVSGSYRKLIEVETKTFSGSFSPVEPHHARVVTEALAIKFANLELGKVSGLSSRASVTNMTEQKIKDKICWVGAVEHLGFWPWKNNDTTPGYVIVSSSNENDRRLVTTLNGKDIKLKVLENSYFGDNATRVAYNSRRTSGQTDLCFEVDDEENPYWVVTTFDHKVGASGSDTTGVIVINAITGETNWYSDDIVPEWIDRIQPSEIVTEQLEDWGEYVHGWLDSWSGSDILRPSKEAVLVYGEDGKTYWYVDVRGKSGDGAIGHILVDSRTKKATLYEVPGSTHELATRSIEGAVQQFKYSCGRILPYLAHGQLVYMGSLFDNSGNRKGIGLALYADPAVVGTGDSVEDALRAIKRAMGNRNGNQLTPDKMASNAKISGTVLSVTFVNDVCYITLVGNEKTLPSRGYAIPRDLTTEVVFTTTGNSVTLGYQSTSESIVDVTEFDNLSLDFKPKSTKDTAATPITVE